MMAALLRFEMPTVMNVEERNCSEIRQKTWYEDDIVVMDGRTTRRKCCGFRKCPRFEHGGCHINLCWTVCLIVVTILLWCPGASFGMPVPGRLEAEQREAGREDGSRQKRAIIGDNVVSTRPKILCLT
jgi:hypothetical protein